MGCRMKLSKSGHRLLEDSRAAALFFPADVYRGVETKRLLADVQSEEVVIRPEISPVNADQVCGNRPFRIGIIGDQVPTQIRSFGATPGRRGIHAAAGRFQ